VVGGGRFGVELAAELAGPGGNRPEGRRAPAVTLLEQAARLVPKLHERIARRARVELEALGVEVRTGTRFVGLGDTYASVVEQGAGHESARELSCALAFWAGGLRPPPVLAHLGLPRTPAGWLAVGPTLQCFPAAQPTVPDVFACGDAVRIVGGTGEWPVSRDPGEHRRQAAVVADAIAAFVDEPADYADGVPPLRPHSPRARSRATLGLGTHTLVACGGLVVGVPVLGRWLRRAAMGRHLERYEVLASVDARGRSASE
jgi:NADH dehydrogenase